MSGKIAVQKLRTLITGRGSKLGSALSRNLVKNGGTIYTVDSRMQTDLVQTSKKNPGVEHFAHGNVADQAFFDGYLQKIGPIDTFVNCAAVRKCK